MKNAPVSGTMDHPLNGILSSQLLPLSREDPYIPYFARFALFVKKPLKLYPQNGAHSFVCVFFNLRKLVCVKITFN